MLLLTPSNGFGGGIERCSASVQREWPGPVTRVDLYRAGFERVGDPSALVKAQFAARALSAAVRDARPDLTLSLHVGMLPVALAVSRLTAARSGLVAHGIEVWGPMDPLRRGMIRRCDVLLGQSSFAVRWFCKRAGIDPGRVGYLPPVIDPALERSARQQPTDYRQDAPPTLLTVSRIDPTDDFKGHFAIAEAFPRVLARRPDAAWTIVGAGDDRPRLEARCAELGIAGAVRFTGRVQEDTLHGLFRAATMFVLPSVADVGADRPTGEGFGLVFAEAGAFGVPIISSADGGGESDLIEDGVTGLTVPRGAPGALSAAILRLLDDRALRERLGTAVRARALANHTPARFREAIVDVAARIPPRTA